MDADKLELIKALQDLEIVDMSKVYMAIGILVVTQLGSMFTLIIAAFKIYGRIVAWKTTIEHVTEENKKDVNEAHGKIRHIEQRMMT